MWFKLRLWLYKQLLKILEPNTKHVIAINEFEVNGEVVSRKVLTNAYLVSWVKILSGNQTIGTNSRTYFYKEPEGYKIVLSSNTDPESYDEGVRADQFPNSLGTINLSTFKVDNNLLYYTAMGTFTSPDQTVNKIGICFYNDIVSSYNYPVVMDTILLKNPIPPNTTVNIRYTIFISRG